MGLRGRRLEVEGCGNGIINTENMWIRCPYENATAAFSDFSTLRPGFKKVHFQVLHLQDPYRRSAKNNEKHVCLH